MMQCEFCGFGDGLLIQCSNCGIDVCLPCSVRREWGEICPVCAEEREKD